MVRTRRSTRAGVALLLAAGLTLAGSPSAAAQQQPRPLLPQPPQEIGPVLALAGPIVWQGCANAYAVVVLSGLLPVFGVRLPPELLVQVSPVLAICGSVPEPDGRRRCALDDQARQVVVQLGDAAGQALPLVLDPVGAVVDELALVQDTLGLGAIDLASNVDAVLQCRPRSDPPTSDAVPTSRPAAETGTVGRVEPPPTGGSYLVTPTDIRLGSPVHAPAESTRRIDSLPTAAAARDADAAGRWPGAVVLALVGAWAIAAGRRARRPDDAPIGLGAFVQERRGTPPSLR